MNASRKERIESEAIGRETVDFSTEFLYSWNQFCLAKGYLKQQAAHAATLSFMQHSTAAERDRGLEKSKGYVTESRTRLGKRNKKSLAKLNSAKSGITKESVRYSLEFFNQWGDFCHSKGLVKRHAATAARLLFMALNADDRELYMEEAMAPGRKQRGSSKRS